MCAQITQKIKSSIRKQIGVKLCFYVIFSALVQKIKIITRLKTNT